MLRIAVVGPAGSVAGHAARHTGELVRNLAVAGHQVTVLPWTTRVESPSARTIVDGVRVLPPIGLTRPDAWLRTGRRLIDHDLVVLVHAGAAATAAELALLRGVHGPGEELRPRVVVVGHGIDASRGAALRALALRALVRRADAVLVHTAGQARLAEAGGAPLVCVLDLPVASEPASGMAQPAERTAGPVPAVLDASVGGQAGGRPPRRTPTRRPDAAAITARAIETGEEVLSASWANYVGAIEAVLDRAAAEQPVPVGTDSGSGETVPGPLPDLVSLACAWWRIRTHVPLHRRDIGEWVRPTDLLLDPIEGSAARREAQRLGVLGRWGRLAQVSGSAIAASADLFGLAPAGRRGASGELWASLGALATVVRMSDDGRRASVVVDESGPASPLRGWLVRVGFAPVELDTLGTRELSQVLELDPGIVDVVAQVPGGGIPADRIDDVISEAAWVLRSGGYATVTVPLGDGPGELGWPEVRGLAARAEEIGLRLVGDLDGDLARRIVAARAAASRRPSSVGSVGAPRGLVRLTFRRR